MTELAHHGVKGMKWGKRKASPSGSPRRKNTKAKVIVATGFALAYNREITAGARFVGDLGKLTLGLAAQRVAQQAETKRGQARAADLMGLPSSATNGPTFANRNRSGAFKITTI